MTRQTPLRRPGFLVSARFAFDLVQGVSRLFVAGAILFEANKLFLRYYAREWVGVQYVGVNDCAGVEQFANGDLYEGKTFCNKLENFVPWFEIYKRHPVSAALYYGVAFLLIIVIAFVWRAVQTRVAPPPPFGGPQRPPDPSSSEHLR